MCGEENKCSFMPSLTTAPEIYGKPQFLTLWGFQCLVQIFHLPSERNSEMSQKEPCHLRMEEMINGEGFAVKHVIFKTSVVGLSSTMSLHFNCEKFSTLQFPHDLNATQAHQVVCELYAVSSPWAADPLTGGGCLALCLPVVFTGV